VSWSIGVWDEEDGDDSQNRRPKQEPRSFTDEHQYQPQHEQRLKKSRGSNGRACDDDEGHSAHNSIMIDDDDDDSLILGSTHGAVLPLNSSNSNNSNISASGAIIGVDPSLTSGAGGFTSRAQLTRQRKRTAELLTDDTDESAFVERIRGPRAGRRPFHHIQQEEQQQQQAGEGQKKLGAAGEPELWRLATPREPGVPGTPQVRRHIFASKTNINPTQSRKADFKPNLTFTSCLFCFLFVL